MDSFDDIQCEDSSEYEHYQHMLEYQQMMEEEQSLLNGLVGQVANLGLEQVYEFAVKLVQKDPVKAELVLDCIEKCFNDQIHMKHNFN